MRPEPKPKTRRRAGPQEPTRPVAVAEAGTSAPLRDLFGFHLRRAHMLFALHWQLSFRDEPIAITPVQGGMLLVIDKNPGLSQVALARLMDVEGPTLVQAIERLEQTGLVERLRRVGDRRSYSLHVTAAGRKVLRAVKEFVPHRESELLTDLSEQERTLLLDMLRRVVLRGQSVTAEMQAAAPARTGAIRRRG